MDEPIVTQRHRAHISTTMALPAGEVIEGGGMVQYADCRQHFVVIEILRGSARKPELTIEYTFLEKSDAFPGPRTEQPIPKGIQVVLMLAENGHLLKAVYDTESIRAKVQAALDRESTD